MRLAAASLTLTQIYTDNYLVTAGCAAESSDGGGGIVLRRPAAAGVPVAGPGPATRRAVDRPGRPRPLSRRCGWGGGHARNWLPNSAGM